MMPSIEIEGGAPEDSAPEGGAPEGGPDGALSMGDAPDFSADGWVVA